MLSLPPNDSVDYQPELVLDQLSRLSICAQQSRTRGSAPYLTHHPHLCVCLGGGVLRRSAANFLSGLLLEGKSLWVFM